MITRHHISLAFGSMLILYFPLVSVNPVVLAVIALGVCTVAVLPDIHMKKPTGFRALTVVWFLIQIFRKTVISFYLLLFRHVFRMQPEEDKRLTHSLPGLLYLTGLIGVGIALLMHAYPAYPDLLYPRMFLAGIIIGLLFHFVEDCCTKKGLVPLYPFNESYRIAGNIRPCNTEDSRIRQFHFQALVILAAIVLLYATGLCPEFLKWPVSIAALITWIAVMFYSAEVRITGSPKPSEPAS